MDAQWLYLRLLQLCNCSPWIFFHFLFFSPFCKVVRSYSGAIHTPQDLSQWVIFHGVAHIMKTTVLFDHLQQPTRA